MADISIDSYVIDSLMPDIVGHDRHPSAFLIYLLLWRRSEGGHEKSVQLSHRALAEGTGLSRRSVQHALEILQRRKLITIARANITAVSTYTVLKPWARRQTTR